jgi:hypothetical protein
MKKVLHGLMAAAVTLGLSAAPVFAAVSPRIESGTTNIEKVQQTTKTTKKKRTARKAPAKKKTQTAKKPAMKKKPAATG